MITDHLTRLVSEAVESAVSEGALSGDVPGEIHFERPRRREHGDLATNVALAMASGRGDPRAAAQAIVDRLPPSDLVERVEIAGPGFLNFSLSPRWLHDAVRRAADPGSGFGRSDAGAGRPVDVEYVSANPTGPINVVSGRHAAVGDAIASLFEATGHHVTREFYINDAGRQTLLFGESVAARYLELHGAEAVIPEDGYRGDYVIDIAREIAERDGDRYVDMPAAERNETMRDLALEVTKQWMRRSLERFGTHHDVWFSERSIHESGAVDKAVARLAEAGLTEEREGAVWFLSSQLGDDKDRVLLRSNSRPTYLASDVAYMLDKISRGFDRLIYLWGADHHGTVARLKAVADALGFGRDRVEIPLVQVVSFKQGTETLKGSKRAGVIFELDDLLDEVGADAVRYTFLTRSIDAPLEFDIALAKEQAPENPVYYVQYAHARICSILRRAADQGVADPDPVTAPLELLRHGSEDALMRKLASYEEVVPEAASQRAPQKLTRFVEELAGDFSAFYRDCKVVSDDPSLTAARLALCVATRSVIADALGLLGVGAPERM